MGCWKNSKVLGSRLVKLRPRMVDRNGGEFGLPPQAQREFLELKTLRSHDFMTFS